MTDTMSRTTRRKTYKWFDFGDERDHRDGKKWHKPPRWFKTKRRRIERAKSKRLSLDVSPKLVKDDLRNWL